MIHATKRSGVGLARGAVVALALLAGTAGATGTAVYSYDAWGRLTSVTYANGNSTAYVYDAAGNRTQVVTATPPVASPIALVVIANSSNNLAPLAVSGAYTAVAVTTSPAHGSTTITGATIKYTPTAGYAGADSFAYTATGTGGTSAPAAVAVAVAPKAFTVSTTVATNSTANPVSLTVVGSHSSVAIATFASHGAATPSGITITYTPIANYWGADSFKYTASNSVATSAPATVNVTINPPPPIALPVSASVSNLGAQPVPLSFSASGGPPTSVAVSTAPTHGSASTSGTAINYTANSGYTGSDSFQYTGTNGAGTSPPAAATLTVLPSYRATISSGQLLSGAQTFNSFGPNAVTVVGGSGSYTYLWTETDDHQGTWTQGGTTSSFSPAVSGVSSGNTANATYTCAVTDTVTHLVATSNGALYQWRNSSGPPP